MKDERKQSILIVEDEPATASTIALYLENEGMEPTIADDGRKGLALATTGQFDLVILDLNLPGRDGVAVCRELRRSSDVPVIMVTARTAEADRVAGLDLGADDYLSKPFSPRELMARVRAALRRTKPDHDSPPLLIRGKMQIDRESRNVSIAGESVDLTHSEYELLLLMASRPGRVWSRGDLNEHLFEEPWTRDERVIDAHIKNLRRKIEKDRANPMWIETVFGAGYRFAAEESAE